MSQCWCGRVFVQDSISASMRKPPQRECWWGGEPHLRCLTGKHEDAGSLSQLASFHPGVFPSIFSLTWSYKAKVQHTRTCAHALTKTHLRTEKNTNLFHGICECHFSRLQFPRKVILILEYEIIHFFFFLQCQTELLFIIHIPMLIQVFFFLIKSEMHSLQPTSLSNLEWSSRRLFWENKNVYTAFLVIFSHSTSFTLQVCIHSFDIQTQASGRRTNQDIEME